MKKQWLWIAAAAIALYWWKYGDCAECGKSPHAAGKENVGSGVGLDVYL